MVGVLTRRRPQEVEQVGGDCLVSDDRQAASLPLARRPGLRVVPLLGVNLVAQRQRPVYDVPLVDRTPLCHTKQFKVSCQRVTGIIYN